MLLEWISIHNNNEIKNNQNVEVEEIKEVYTENFDIKIYEQILSQINEIEGISIDEFDNFEENSNLFDRLVNNYLNEINQQDIKEDSLFYYELPDHLLDITYFRILKKLERNKENEVRNHLREVANDIPYIKYMIKEGKARIFDFRVKDEEFEKNFDVFYNDLNYILHDRYSNEEELKNCKFPEGKIEIINNEEVKNLIYSINETIDSEEMVLQKKRKINKILHKIAVKYNNGGRIYNIIKKYSELEDTILNNKDEGKPYSKYREISYLCINKNKIVPIIVPIIKEHIEKIFMLVTKFVSSESKGDFEKYSEFKNIISDYYKNVHSNGTSIIRKFFNINPNRNKAYDGRCVALIEFPNRSNEDMFSISGMEFIENNGKIERNKIYEEVAKYLKKELYYLGKYTFCPQNFFVRRYNIFDKNKPNSPRTLDNTGIFTKLTNYKNWKKNYEYMKNNPNWLNERRDYSCCERKFLANLEEKNIKSCTAYPDKIIIYVTKDPCPMCIPALEYYRLCWNTGSSVICNLKNY